MALTIVSWLVKLKDGPSIEVQRVCRVAVARDEEDHDLVLGGYCLKGQLSEVSERVAIAAEPALAI